ncbi:hypothetical protein TRIP_B120037 [uncultured Desulfatiglans sp.]|nr:hypothetical protein TRIP_B120037 [uncultured Desulfatiglans sp.]
MDGQRPPEGEAMQGEHQTERTPVETRSNPKSKNPAADAGAEPSPLSADGLVLVPLAAAADEGLDLPVEQVLHLEWDAPAFSPRGNSLVLPAFQSIELLRDYRRAEQAIAKRWATPFRLLKVGGAFGQKMVMPDQKMHEQVRDMVNKMDLKSGLVVPFYVTVETHGTEGQVLNVEDKVKEVKEDIVVKVLEDGFEFEGRRYKSLSAIARAAPAPSGTGSSSSASNPQ